MPRLYLLVLLCTLVSICVVITNQVVHLINREKHYIRLSKNLANNSISIDDFLALAKIYTLKKSWFSCIKLLEKQLISYKHFSHICYNAIGFCYYNMKFLNLSKTYYLYSIQSKSDYILALNNLAKVYKKIGLHNQAREVYESILYYQSNDSVAKHELTNKKSG
uniref:Photosystem I assembly protein Ycf37 n=1 Tax=Sporolithon durum TaxID=48970 RepID=A0A141SD27_9FLOR|nr:hypothetical protein Sdur_150 [Sporolithon durum]AMK96195.1 hypothetical protein Sdur_150 [Sporolithon durum]